MSHRDEKGTGDLLIEAAQIAEQEKHDVTEFGNNANQDLSDMQKVINNAKADVSDPEKLRADVVQGNVVFREAENDVQDFQNQWKDDTGAAQEFAAQVKGANLPAAQMAVANQANAIQNEAEGNVKALNKEWSAIDKSALVLAKRVDNGQGYAEQNLKDAEALEKATGDGLGQFGNAMQGVRSKLTTLEKEIEG